MTKLAVATNLVDEERPATETLSVAVPGLRLVVSCPKVPIPSLASTGKVVHVDCQ